MATAADVRGKGRGVPSNAAIDAWNAAHPDDPYEPGPPRDSGTNGHAPDYPDDDFDTLFPDAGPGPAADGDTGETPPRKTTPRGRASKGRLGGLFGKRDAKGKAKKKPRVSTEEILGSIWRGAAKLAAPLPPLHRTLRVQAPVAGLLLEDVVKDTAVDVLLQPFARYAESGKVVSALLGPPMLVTAITVHVNQAVQAGQEPNQVFLAVAQEMLRTSLMTWLEVAGPKFKQAMEKEKEFEEKYGADVDEFMAWLFSAPPSTEAEAEAEAAMFARATGRAA